MSLLANHGLIGRSWMIPVVTNLHSASQSGVTYTTTPVSVPPTGDLIIIMAGGLQTRASVSIPSGFTELAGIGGGARTNSLFWKVATSSEPASYSITWDGTLSGGIASMVISNVNISSPINYQVGNSGVSVTSLSLPSHNIPNPGVAITIIAKSGTAAWTADNGYTNVNPSGQFKGAYKHFSAIAVSQAVAWSGTVESVTSDLFLVNARQI